MNTLPASVKIAQVVPAAAIMETEITVPGGVCDSIRSREDSSLIFMSLSGRRPENCAADDWRGIVIAAIARLREIENHLEGLLLKQTTDLVQ